MEPTVNTSAGPETATQTVSRIKDALANPTTSGTSSFDNSFFTSLQNTLLKNADLVSSGDSNIETAIGSAIDRINQGQAAQANRINSEAAEQSRNIQRSGLIQQTNAVEGRRGFATQTAVLRNILNTTNQELKDLETRRQDLLASGEAEAASQVAQLQVQSLQLAQQAKQNAVSNMINLSNNMFDFRRLQMDEEQQRRDNALETISTLQSIGTLQGSDPETLRNLERSGGLPSGTLSNIPDVPAEYEIRKVGSALLAIDPADPTNVKVIYSGGTGGAVDSLSIKDTQDLGLPISIAGLTEQEVIESLADSEPPQWFTEAENATNLQSIHPSTLTEKWNEYRANLLQRTAVPENEELDPVEQLLLEG